MNIEAFYNSPGQCRLFLPSRIFSGSGMAAKAAEVIAGCGDLVVVVDAFFAQHPLVEALAQAAGGAVTIARVEGAPYAQDIEATFAGLPRLPQAIVSIGGGSAADYAKGLILLNLFGTLDGVGIGPKLAMPRRPEAVRPLYLAVPTTAGSGAEASRYYVTYCRQSHGKVFGKTWDVVADWIFLDPDLLADMPLPTLVGCAFDAFVHYFETLIARCERSSFGEMLSLHGIPILLTAVADATDDGRRDADTHTRLLEAATLAGGAISNVRTGHIHEAAGALLEHTPLTHAETLFVFFREAVAHYREAIRDREAKLLPRLSEAGINVRSIEDLVAWWEDRFARTGLTTKIENALRQCRTPAPELKQHIFERVITDKVWVTKECPTPISDSQCRRFIETSLSRFGLE